MYGNTATNHAHGTSLYTRGSTLGMQGFTRTHTFVNRRKQPPVFVNRLICESQRLAKVQAWMVPPLWELHAG